MIKKLNLKNEFMFTTIDTIIEKAIQTLFMYFCTKVIKKSDYF